MKLWNLLSWRSGLKNMTEQGTSSPCSKQKTTRKGGRRSRKKKRLVVGLSRQHQLRLALIQAAVSFGCTKLSAG